jgi:hypothetical protein
VSPGLAVAAIAVGFAAGVLSGLVGVGGATLTTPGLRFLGAPAIIALGSTIPPIIPGAVSGSARFAKAGLVDWPIALTTAAAGTAFTLVGAFVSDHVNAHLLMIVTAVLIGWSAWTTSRSARITAPVGAPEPTEPTTPAAPAPEPEVQRGTGRVAAVGAVGGFVAGVLGIGGGVVLVPAFTSLLHLPVRKAVASSLVAVAIFSVPAMIAHAHYGHINWAWSLYLTIGTVPGAQVGAHVTVGSSERRMRLIVGLFLGALAVVYAAREILALF